MNLWESNQPEGSQAAGLFVYLLHRMAPFLRNPAGMGGSCYDVPKDGGFGYIRFHWLVAGTEQ